MVSWCKKGAYNAQTSPKSELSGSSAQTLTTNVSMTLCDSQIRHQTHVLCGCTTFGTELKLGPKLIRPYAYCSLDKGVAYTRGGGDSARGTATSCAASHSAPVSLGLGTEVGACVRVHLLQKVLPQGRARHWVSRKVPPRVRALAGGVHGHAPGVALQHLPAVVRVERPRPVHLPFRQVRLQKREEVDEALPPDAAVGGHEQIIGDRPGPVRSEVMAVALEERAEGRAQGGDGGTGGVSEGAWALGLGALTSRLVYRGENYFRFFFFGRPKFGGGGIWYCSLEMKENFGIRPLVVAS